MKDNLIISNKNYKSRLIVGTGKYKNFNECAKAIKLSGAEVITFDKISIEPTLKSFEIASQFALENSFDLIVAAGGGSTID